MIYYSLYLHKNKIPMMKQSNDKKLLQVLGVVLYVRYVIDVHVKTCVGY